MKMCLPTAGYASSRRQVVKSERYPAFPGNEAAIQIGNLGPIREIDPVGGIKIFPFDPDYLTV